MAQKPEEVAKAVAKLESVQLAAQPVISKTAKRKQKRIGVLSQLTSAVGQLDYRIRSIEKVTYEEESAVETPQDQAAQQTAAEPMAE